jgi:hypothetical protein
MSATPTGSFSMTPAFAFAYDCALLQIGPKGIEFAKYSIDYHYIRNFLYVNRHMGPARAARHIPGFGKK